MSTKLTLTVDKTIIAQAKKYARNSGRSLSEIIENYLKVLTSEERRDLSEVSPVVKSLKGSFKAPKVFDYKEELTKALTEKYIDS
ncbi:MAG: hypothetical protein KTR24_16680 [Saprospiraceae bacterium]|nr:hypothetical protein [Saprospiraceae bacterium]